MDYRSFLRHTTVKLRVRLMYPSVDDSPHKWGIYSNGGAEGEYRVTIDVKRGKTRESFGDGLSSYVYFSTLRFFSLTSYDNSPSPPPYTLRRPQPNAASIVPYRGRPLHWMWNLQTQLIMWSRKSKIRKASLLTSSVWSLLASSSRMAARYLTIISRRRVPFT